MTSNAGTEYINLKQAKYNRDRRLASMARVDATNAVKCAPGVSTNVYSKSVPANQTVDSGISVKDVIGLAIDSLMAGIAKKRKMAARERANATKYVAKYVKCEKAFPVSVIGYIIVFSVIAVFLVMGNSRICDATLKVDALKGQIAAEMSAGEILDSSLNQKFDAARIEDYAVNVLGMVKGTDVAKKYISISGEDKIVLSGVNKTSGTYTDASLMLDSMN